ncbi:[FeFe] hydrogenase H-cluster maturation GTPase HydF [Gemmatimonadota bacterium]
MQDTPSGMRLQIGIVGRRNTGKSSLLNMISRQNISIVSPEAGTTTDPVHRSMEFLPLGPVMFHDTAGLDDSGALGQKRIATTRAIIDRLDLGILVTVADRWDALEEGLLDEFRSRGIPIVVVFNKCDLARPDGTIIRTLRDRGLEVIETICTENQGIEDLREAMISTMQDGPVVPVSITAGVISAGDLAVLVTPIDLEAPKGRLILPQVQTIRDLLERDAYCLVVREHQLTAALKNLKEPPVIVITDSQAFRQVAESVPPDIPLTSFSILYSRFKGDLEAFAEGARAIDGLSTGDEVLIAEACTHHPIGDDIGTQKIPALLNGLAGGGLKFRHVQGQDFPDSPEGLQGLRLVVHCGACMLNRRNMMSRIERCREAGVPITNYGMTIAWCLGIFDRAMEPLKNLSDS